MNQRFTTRNIVLAAFFLALTFVMPFLTMQIPEIGSALLPMHLPVLICGFVCGGPLGALVGFIAPLLRSAIFGMPPMVVAVSMSFEMAAYGFFCGLLYDKLPKNIASTYVSLLLSMIIGRVVWGIAAFAIFSFVGNPFTFTIFLNGAFISAIPGIIAQIVIVPLLVIALERAGYLKKRVMA